MASSFQTSRFADDSALAHIGTLWFVAQRLRREHRAPQSLPPLWFVTDPRRTPDPIAVAERLPSGAGVIYRAFGADDAKEVALALVRVAQHRRLILLIGADERLAASVRAHGVHLPERMLGAGPMIRARRAGWLITGAAHSARALYAVGRFGLDAALLSPVFNSASPSATTPLTPIRYSSLARTTPLPVYALGGVTPSTAPRLIGAGAAGLAAVDGLARA